jgi:hypothetical protein
MMTSSLSEDDEPVYSRKFHNIPVGTVDYSSYLH